MRHQLNRAQALHRQRGQATLETALFVPIFLIVLFGVIWVVQSSVINERVQAAVRFSGLVSNEASPYTRYGLGALYDGLPGVAPTEVYTCVAPTTDALENNGYFPGPQTATFFQPASGQTSGSCSQNVTYLSGGTLTQPILFVQTTSNITSAVSIPSYLANILNNPQFLTASQNFFDTPDMQSLMDCYTDFGNAAAASLLDTAQNASVAPTPLPDTPNTTPLALDTSC